MKHFWKWPLICLGAFLMLFLIYVTSAIVQNLVELRNFYNTALPEFFAPGIEDTNFDGQGIDYDSDSNLFFFTGYMRDRSANPVYLVDAQSGKTIKLVRLLNSDGSAFCGHAGGIAVTEDYVYIAGSVDCCLFVYDKNEILCAENGDEIRCIGKFPTAISDEDGVKASFLTVEDGKVFVGEFHLPLISAYRLRDNHKLKTHNGNNCAVMIGFDIDTDAPLGLSDTPCIAYSLPDKVQGLCFNASSVILSSSYGITPSTITYTYPVPEGTFKIMNTVVPLYSLKNSFKVRIPPASEEIDICEGRLYIASELYNAFIPGFGHPWGAEYCWSMKPN